MASSRAHRKLDENLTRQAFALLDKRIQGTAHMVVGGGAAMLLAYKHPLSTQVVDAFSARGSLRVAEMDGAAKAIAAELDIEPDWLNAHFETYTGVLPGDYSARLRRVFDGNQLVVDALGPEDLLVMKCFARRDKDRPHARKLLRVATDLGIVDRQLSLLTDKRYPGAAAAADWFDDLRDSEGL